MEFKIKEEVFEEFNEDFKTCLIYCPDIDNKDESPEIYEMIRDIEELIRVNHDSPTEVQNQGLISSFRSAVRHFGPEFEHYQTNVEKMVKKILNKEDIEREDKINDLTNFISLKHKIPLGTIDLDKVTGDLTYKIADGDEKFKSSDKKVKENELILKDSLHIISTKLDYNTEETYKPEEETKDALIHIEALPPIGKEKLNDISEDLIKLIEIFCDCKTQKYILDKNQNKCKIE